MVAPITVIVTVAVAVAALLVAIALRVTALVPLAPSLRRAPYQAVAAGILPALNMRGETLVHQHGEEVAAAAIMAVHPVDAPIAKVQVVVVRRTLAG